MTDNTTESLAANAQQQQKSAVQIRLLKGPVFRHKQRDLWQWLERDQYQIREYFQQIGLSLLLDDAEGYAFLRQQEWDDDANPDLPRLINRRSLTFGQTLLLVSLRKRLAEHDSEDSSPRLIVRREEMYQWLQPHFAETANQVKQHKEFDSLISKVIEMGFLSQLNNHPDDFEVQRIIKAFVTAEQIISFTQVLEQLSADPQDEQGED